MLFVAIMWNFSFVLAFLALIGGSNGFTAQRIAYPGQNAFFELSIVHFNDFHARFLQTSPTSGTCMKGREADCVGGLGRIVTASRQLLQERPNAIFLNAGDFYQGTLWYNVHKWNATVHFMNKLPHDAMTLGNHEFDDGIEGLIPFLERAQSPFVVANIDDSEEPTIQGLFKKNTVITRGNRTIGIIGVVTKDTTTLAHTGKLKFLDEVEAVNAETAKLRAEGVDIVIVLSHCGLDTDRIIAANCPEIDVIVGGHSHTFLYSGKPPFVDVPEDEYPVVVKRANNGGTVLIVQAAAFTKYLGNLTLWFNELGEVVDWEGNPLLLDDSVQEDPEILKELKPWEEAVAAINNKVIGETRSFLDHSCRSSECTLGNLIADAMVHAYRNKTDRPDHWTYAAISLINAGSIRSSIPVGKITYGDIMITQPFGHTWDIVELKGEDLHAALEECVAHSSKPDYFVNAGFLQLSGVKVAYDLAKPAGSRITTLKVRCQACKESKYEELQTDNWYRVVVPSFIVTGGDNLTVIMKNHRNHRIGPLDVGPLVDYIQLNTPIDYKLEQRIQTFGEWSS